MSRASTRSRRVYAQSALPSVEMQEAQVERAAFEAHMKRVGQETSDEAEGMWLERASMGLCRICGRAPKRGESFCKMHREYATTGGNG